MIFSVSIENFSGNTLKILKFAILFYTFSVFYILSVFKVLDDNKIADNRNPDTAKEISTVSDLQAEFRYGQVFLIWKESTGNNKNLRVYISEEPITSKNFLKAQLLTDQLEPHSANDWYNDPNECPHTTGPVHGWIIESERKPLDRNGGLFVHTVLQKDPHLAYFAVLGVGENGDKLKTGINSLQMPIAINVEQMQAIWQLHDMPSPAEGKPLVISLHSHQSRPKGELTYLFFGDSSMGWREGLPFKFKVTVGTNAVLMEPYDRVWINRRMTSEEAKANNGTYDTLYKEIESWWYGTNNKINDPGQMSTGTPTNYTERWLLWAMKWVQQNYRTNPNKVYALGASMGTGILRLVLRNPDRFASIDLLVPILDPFGEGNIGERMKSRVGKPQSICSDGITLSDRLNAINSIKATKRDLPPIVIRIGRQDKSVFWARKPAFIKAVQEQKQALFVGWDNGTHSTAMRKHYDDFPNWFDFNWHINHFAINKSYPVFTKCSLDDNPGDGDTNVGDTTGFINRGLDWKVISDTNSRYQLLVMINRPVFTYPIYVNITPRRYQKFQGANNSYVYAYNINAEGKVIEKKKLIIKEGLITYDKFAITSSSGNRLLISREKITPSHS